MKVISFLMYSAGGILGSLLNNEDLLIDDAAVYGDTHSALTLRKYDPRDPIDRAKFQKRIAKFRDSTSWLGTHLHPVLLQEYSEITQIAYIRVSTPDSICATAIRKLYCEGTEINRNNLSLTISSTILENPWLLPVSRKNVHTIEFEDLRKNLDKLSTYVSNLNGYMDYEKFAQWKQRNQYVDQYLPQAIEVFESLRHLKLNINVGDTKWI